jgi:CubicO group peptidase (beta-lactamase class C family)
MRPARRKPAHAIRAALLLWASLFCIGARAAQAPASQAGQNLDAQIDAIVAAVATSSPTAGLTIGVERMGKTIFLRAYGEADRENHAKATEHTVYGVGSITKVFAAAMVFRLIERGSLSLDDDVTRFVPDFPEPNGAISIEHLLHHTSGIPDFEYVGEWPNSMALPRTKPQVVATFRDLPRLFAPGTRWAYSSSGYYLLGLVIEKIVGRPYEDVLRDEVFAPAGLAETTFCDPFSIIEHRARGYGFGDDSTMRNAAPVVLTQYGLSGAICSTASDLLRFWRALEGGRIVSAASFAKMSAARPLPDGTATSYGYGIIPGAYKGHRVLFHSGHVPGYTAQLARYPDDELTIVVLTNTDSLAPLQIESRIADLLLVRR